MLETIKTILTVERGRHVLYECRHCGVSLDSDDEDCPACGADEIARIVF